MDLKEFQRSDLQPMKGFSFIGTGELGGKAKGLSLMKEMLEEAFPSHDITVCVRVDNLDPASEFAGLNHAVDSDHISGISHKEIALGGQSINFVESGSHLHIQLGKHFVLFPIVVHIALYLFKITAGYTAGIS